MKNVFTKEQKAAARKVFNELMSRGVRNFSYEIENPNADIPELYDDERTIVITIHYNLRFHRDDIYTIDKAGLILFNGATSGLNF